MGIKLEKNISQRRGGWGCLIMAMSTDACWGGHYSVEPGIFRSNRAFFGRTMHFAVEPGFFRSNECYNCRIKTGHSNLVSCFGPRMRALAKVFYRGESRGKIPCQRPNSRAKTWHKIWITGLNPNYDTIPIPSLQNSQNKCQNPRLFTIAGAIWFCRYRQCTPSQRWMHALVAKKCRLMTS